MSTLAELSAIQWALTCVIMFGALVVRGLSGFGASVVAMPLLVMVLPVHLAVTLVSPLMWITFVALTARDRRAVLWGEVVRVLAPTLIGVAAGLYLFNRLDHAVLIKLFGGFIAGYAVYAVVVDLRGLSSVPCSRLWAHPAGFAGGFLDTIFGGGGGPALVIYLHRRQFVREAFRATLVAVWMLEATARIVGYTWSGYYSLEVVPVLASLLPAMWLGNRLGERIQAGISQRVFNRVVAALLLVSGIALLLR